MVEAMVLTLCQGWLLLYIHTQRPVHMPTLTDACTLVFMIMLQHLESLGMLVEDDPYEGESSVCFRCQRLSGPHERWLLCLFCCNVSTPAMCEYSPLPSDADPPWLPGCRDSVVGAASTTRCRRASSGCAPSRARR